MWQKGEFRRGSTAELLAWLVWMKDKTIFAKNTLSILLSNMGSDKCFDKYKEMQEEIFPALKSIREEQAKKNAAQLKQISKEKIIIHA